MTPGVEVNAIGLALEILGHAGVPLRVQAEALRKMAAAHRANGQSISRTPTGATPQLAALLAGLENEARTMEQVAKGCDARADEEDKAEAKIVPPQGAEPNGPPLGR
jgi:hypothetical protein